MSAESFVGIDVSKDRLDIALRPTSEHWTIDYTEAEVAQLVNRLKELQPALIVLEATGGLELPVAAALAAAGLPVAVVNPRQVPRLCPRQWPLGQKRSLGCGCPGAFGQALRPPVRPLPDAEAQQLAALVTRRRQLLEMLKAERNRLASSLPAMRSRIQAHIDWWSRICKRSRLMEESTPDGDRREKETSCRERPVSVGFWQVRCCPICRNSATQSQGHCGLGGYRAPEPR